MEARLGHDFASVRIHDRDESAPRIGALAYTRGEHLHFAPGAYRPESAGGRAVLGHELAHVVQQRQGRVHPTRRGPIPLNDSAGLEREADAHASTVARPAALLPNLATMAPGHAASSPTVQMIPLWKKALYGLGAVGGGVALAAGAWTAAPALAVGGALAAGGSALLAHRDRAAEQRAAALKLERQAREPGIKERTERDKQARAEVKAARGTKLAKTGNKRTQANLAQLHGLRKELARSGESPLLHKVLAETLGQANLKDTSIRGGSGTSHGETARDDYGGHEVRLDDLETNETRRQSYLLHELTHVAADRKYSLNRVEGQQFANTPYLGNDAATLAHSRARRAEIENTIGIAKDTAWKDESLSKNDREYVHDRLHYISSMPGVEHDTVANELLLYAHQKKLPANSPTVKQIHSLAADAYRRRNGPYAATGKLK
jgi:hypothetical protein